MPYREFPVAERKWVTDKGNNNSEASHRGRKPALTGKVAYAN